MAMSVQRVFRVGNARVGFGEPAPGDGVHGADDWHKDLVAGLGIGLERAGVGERDVGAHDPKLTDAVGLGIPAVVMTCTDRVDHAPQAAEDLVLVAVLLGAPVSTRDVGVVTSFPDPTPGIHRYGEIDQAIELLRASAWDPPDPGLIPDPANARRAGLAKALSPKAAQARYEAFLDRVPTVIAQMAAMRHGEDLRRALDAYDEARGIAAAARGLSLDAQGTVYELAGVVARLAPRP